MSPRARNNAKERAMIQMTSESRQESKQNNTTKKIRKAMK